MFRGCVASNTHVLSHIRNLSWNKNHGSTRKIKYIFVELTSERASVRIGLETVFSWQTRRTTNFLGGLTRTNEGTSFLNITDKKENQICLMYKEIQSGADAKSYMRKGFLLYEEMRKYFPIYEEAVSHMTLQLLHSEFPYIWGKFDFLFYQCGQLYCISAFFYLYERDRRADCPYLPVYQK